MDIQEFLDCKVLQDPKEVQVWPVDLVWKVHLVRRETKETLDNLETLDLLDHEDTQVHQVLKESKESLDYLELEYLDSRVILEHQGKLNLILKLSTFRT